MRNYTPLDEQRWFPADCGIGCLGRDRMASRIRK
jgi:hypothetical protein